MIIYNLLLPLSLLGTAALVAANAVTSSTQKPTPAPGGSPQPDKAEAGKAANAAMPKLVLAPEHAILKKMVGTWDASVTSTMPGMPPMNWTAKAVYKAVGESWIVSDFEGSMNGAPYVGHGVDGYDTNKKKFVGAWDGN